MGTMELKSQIAALINELPARKLEGVKRMLVALLHNDTITDDLTDVELKEIKKELKDTEKDRIYSVQEVITEYKQRRKKKCKANVMR